MSARDASSPLLEVRDLVAGYGGSEVLHGISLSVFPGETVVILGPNGHGKTTLLRAISGLVPIRRGRITLDTRQIHGRAPDAIVGQGLVHIPQGDLLFPEMTVMENLLMGAYRSSAWARRSERLEQIFAFFPRLAERQKQLARTLSGGERRMLAIGRGLMGEARLLMVDEPSLGLAPVVIEDLYRRLGEIRASGLPVLLVEESAAHVEELADRLYLLENGEIVREGVPSEILADEAVLRSYLGVA
jgi:branched-chain amino acid transport system ATP-binding protein